MPITLDSIIRQGRDVLITEAAGESVLLDLKSDKYFGLDDVGTQMWQAVVGAATLREAHERLLKIYQVEPDVLEHDLLQWLEQMASYGLIEVTSV